MNKANVCPTLPELESFILGKPPEESIDATIAHLKECETCRESLWQIDCSDDPLLSLLRQPPGIESYTTEQDCLTIVQSLISGRTDWLPSDEDEVTDEEDPAAEQTPKASPPKSPAPPPLTQNYPVWIAIAVVAVVVLVSIGVWAAF